MSVKHSARSGRRHNRDIFSIFFNMKVCCVLLLESPHRGKSNEHTQYTIFKKKKKKISLVYPKSAAMVFCSWGLKNEFEIAVVNEPSVFVPLKFYCIYIYPAAKVTRKVMLKLSTFKLIEN